MATEHDPARLPPEVERLMRWVGHVNAGAMIALCLWLGTMAMASPEPATDTSPALVFGDCGCTLTVVNPASATQHQAALP